jgi:hypothetical protein
MMENGRSKEKESFGLRHRLTGVLGGWATAVCVYVFVGLVVLSLIGW